VAVGAGNLVGGWGKACEQARSSHSIVGQNPMSYIRVY